MDMMVKRRKLLIQNNLVSNFGYTTLLLWTGYLITPILVIFITEWVFRLNSVQFSCSVMSNSLQPHESQHSRPPCPSPTPGVHSNPHPSSQWCHLTISSSVIHFSCCPQSFPASGSFPISQMFTSGGQVLEFQLQHHSFHWTPRTDLL